MTVAVLHSYTHVLGWAYFRIGWAYFRVKGGPIFGRGVLENTPIPLFEQILNSSPMGVFSRDYGTALCGQFGSQWHNWIWGRTERMLGSKQRPCVLKISWNILEKKLQGIWFSEMKSWYILPVYKRVFGNCILSPNWNCWHGFMGECHIWPALKCVGRDSSPFFPTIFIPLIAPCLHVRVIIIQSQVSASYLHNIEISMHILEIGQFRTLYRMYNCWANPT